MIIKLAMYNLKRHPKRTLGVIIALGLSLFILEIFSGLAAGMKKALIETVTENGAHVVLRAGGWKEKFDPSSLDPRISGADGITRRLRVEPHSVSAESVVEFAALLANEGRSIGMLGIGLEDASTLYQNAGNNLVSGSFPPAAEGIVLSENAYRVLNLGGTRSVVVLVEDAAGSPYYLDLPVTGIFSSGSNEFDNSFFFINRRTAGELLGIPDEATGIRIRLDSAEFADSFIAGAADLISAEGLEAETWKQENASLLGLMDFFDVFLVVMNTVILIVAATLTANTFLMNLFDRMREFGTFRAIGMRKSLMKRILVTEGLAQGILGGLSGLGLSVPAILYFRENSINWGGLSDIMGIGTRVSLAFSPVQTAVNCGAVVLVTVFCSLYAGRVGCRHSIRWSLEKE